MSNMESVVNTRVNDTQRAAAPQVIQAPSSLVVVDRAAQLSLAELGLGSLLQAFHIPLGGHFMSLNQGYFLTHALLKDDLETAAVFEISGISAMMKSLSPMGNKLGPMISITTQGWLYWLGVTAGGRNLLGCGLGMILLSLWAFLQPLVTLLLIYGFDFYNILLFYKGKLESEWPWAPDFLLSVLIVLIAVKLCVAILIPILVMHYRNTNPFIVGRVHRPLQKKRNDSFMGVVLRSFFRPLFLLTFIMMIFFYYFREGNWSSTLWLALRPLALGVILLWFLRSPLAISALKKWSHRSEKFRRFHQRAQLAFYKIISSDS